MLVALPLGCHSPVREEVDRMVCDFATHPFDMRPSAPTDAAAPPASEKTGAADQTWDLQQVKYESQAGAAAGTQPGSALRGTPEAGKLLKQLRYPKELPGAQTPPISVPPQEPQRQQALEQLYRTLPELGPNPQPLPGPNGRPLTLPELQDIAMRSSPAVRQAAAAVKAAEGAARQAGFYPNPNVGYEGDVMGTGGSAGLHGGWFDQVIKTAGKLKLAQAAAIIDVWNARLSLRKAQADLAYHVRLGYFGLLVARKSLEVSTAMTRFIDHLYGIQVAIAKGPTGAPYEPALMRTYAYQARVTLIQARNRYVSTWKQLAAAMGVPAMPLTEVAGDADMPVPLYDYDQVLTRVLAVHTEVLTAQNSLQQARYNLRLAEVTPYPDVYVRGMVQKDNTTLPHEVVPSVVIGLPLPLWNRNEGNIQQAQGNLLQAVEQPHLTRNTLTAQTAEAFQRYRDNRLTLEIYVNHIIPDFVRAYRGSYERHNVSPNEVGFADVVFAQQNLMTSITTYLTALGNMWTAVADLAHLLQTPNVFEPQLPTAAIARCPALEQLLALPCCHPCSPLPDPNLRGADGSWPAIMPKLTPNTPPTEETTPESKPQDQLPAQSPPPSQARRAEEPLLPDLPPESSRSSQRGFRKLPWQL